MSAESISYMDEKAYHRVYEIKVETFLSATYKKPMPGSVKPGTGKEERKYETVCI